MMVQDETHGDRRIAQALTADAPPPRDAMFRIAVLERRERQRFQRRSLWLMTAATTLAAIWVIGFQADAGVLASSAIAILAASLVGSSLIAIPVAMRLLGRLTRSVAAK